MPIFALNDEPCPQQVVDAIAGLLGLVQQGVPAARCVADAELRGCLREHAALLQVGESNGAPFVRLREHAPIVGLRPLQQEH